MPSMGSIGDCYDSMIDSFWLRMQVERLDRRRWTTRIELGNAMFDCIRDLAQPATSHPSLGMLTPIQFEVQTPIFVPEESIGVESTDVVYGVAPLLSVAS